jgi:hypothetical protein
VSRVEVYFITKVYIIKAIVHERGAGGCMFWVLNVDPFPKYTEWLEKEKKKRADFRLKAGR